MASYLAATPPAVKTRTLADLIAFDRAHADVEMPFFAQEDFEKAEATKGLDDPDYLAARATSLRLAGPEGLGRLMDEQKLDAIVSPTRGPAPLTDVAGVSHGGGGGVITGLAAVSGYPHLTVPMGQVMGLPVGLSFVGRPWSEARLLSLGFAFEQTAGGHTAPTYAVSVEQMPESALHVQPYGAPKR
jgi:amidase